jgi:hypothetical protein
MSISISQTDNVGLTVESDPLALKIASNLSDLASAPTARTNLGVEYATNDQALTGTSQTTTLNPLTSIISQMNTNVIQPNLAQFAASTSGSGAATSIPSTSAGFALTSPTVLVGYAIRYVGPLVKGVAVTGNIQWTRPAGFCARLVNPNFNTFQTQAVARVSLGKQDVSIYAGPPTARGIAVSYGASATSVLSALVLEVHDGTSLTTVTSSFTPTMNLSFDIAVYSDGLGNVTLYANGSQVATTAAGPKTNGGGTYETKFMAEIQNTSTATQTSYVRVENMKYFVN